MRKNYTSWLLYALAGFYFMVVSAGCANIVPPTGGARDSLPPRLIVATPFDSSTNFKGNRITLTFDEFVEVQNAFENVIVSPTQQNTPTIDYKLRTVSVRLRDTLEPNTTYSINFGDAIKDVNEGNVYKAFTYVFSTGNTIDEYIVRGKVVLAETGATDSTLIVVLHRNMDDSAVAKERPRYITRVDGQGNFQFNNLPQGRFAIYAIPSGFSRRYDDTTKPFAFADTAIVTGPEDKPITLFAYSLPKVEPAPAATGAAPAAGRRAGTARAAQEKQLSYSSNAEGGRLDLLSDLQLNFVQKIATYDSNRITLTGADF
ncbi:MAG: hypothetical protein JWQ96_6, partial [Segetibacter sp.]|nr:hypothetical protein [Segetibacter sp.]